MKKINVKFGTIAKNDEIFKIIGDVVYRFI